MKCARLVDVSGRWPIYDNSYMASNGLCFMVTWTIFEKPSLGGRSSNTKPGDHGTPNARDRFIHSILSCVRTRMNRKLIEITFGWGPGHIWLHTILEDLWPTHLMSLDVSRDNVWTLSFELSQFHGHGSWIVCGIYCHVHYLMYSFIVPFSMPLRSPPVIGEIFVHNHRLRS